MAEIQLIPLLRPVQRGLPLAGLRRGKALPAIPAVGLARGIHSSLTNTDPMRAIWRRPPVKADKLGQDFLNMRERVQSVLEARGWHEGWGYYNTYSSKDLHVAPIEHGLREIEAGDGFEFGQEPVTLQTVKDFARADQGYHDDSQFARHGTLALLAQDRTVSVLDLWNERHGLWTLAVVRDDLRADESQQRHGILALGVQREDVGLSERQSIPEQSVTERFTVADRGEQHGLRDFVYRDEISEGVAVQNNGTRTKSVVDAFTLADEPFTRSGLRALTVVGDPVTLTERQEQHGRRLQQVSDQAVLSDTGYQRGGVRAQRVRDDLTLQETVTPFRFDWREKVSLSETGRLSERTFPLPQERVRLTDDGRLDVRVSEYEAADQGQLSERFSLGPWKSEYRAADPVDAADAGLWQRAALGRAETVALGEVFLLNGRVTLAPQVEPVQLGELGRVVNVTPLRLDLLSLNDAAYAKHGTALVRAEDSVSLNPEPDLGLHGKRSVRMVDAALFRDGAQYPPRSVFAQDAYRLLESGFGPPSSSTDYVLMRETYDIENLIERVKLTDTGAVLQGAPRRRDDLTLSDRGLFRGTLDQKDPVGLREARVLTRTFDEADGARLGETSRLFRRTDYLEPLPDLYQERPDRYRSAFSLIRSPAGEVWAAWTGQGLLHRAKRPYADSWRSHTEETLAAPAGARRVTLVFRQGRPLFVTEAGSELIFEDGHRLPGVDPVSLQGELYWLSPDRRTLHAPDGETDLGRRSYLRQSFTGDTPGVYLLDEFGRVTTLPGSPPARLDFDPDTASARWEVDPVSRVFIPIEGAVIHARD